MLFASGELDRTVGGPPAPLEKETNRRTLYTFVSRSRPDPVLALFDFPNPNQTVERRIPTSTPLQGLYFLNSEFVMQRAAAFAKCVAAKPDENSRVREAYRLLYYREPSRDELRLAHEYLQKASWSRYAQALLTSNEFTHQN
jgi:hypothetical protein